LQLGPETVIHQCVLDNAISLLLPQPAPAFCLILALFTSLLLGYTRSSLGAGGFVVSPLMILALGPTGGLAVVALLMVAAGAVSIRQHRGEADRDLQIPLVISALVGTLVGGLVLMLLMRSGNLDVFHRRMEIIVGLLSLLYVLLVSLHDRITRNRPAHTPNPKSLFATGTLVSLSQTVANSGTPLITLYFLWFGMKKEHFVADQVQFIFVQNVVKLIPLILLGILHPASAISALFLLPAALAGNWIGKRSFNQMSEKAYFRIYAALLLVGFLSSLILIWGRASFLEFISGG